MSRGKPWDVVVVGGGTAGCVLAARLSEDRARQVLVLEAGPDYPTVESLPADVRDGWRVAFSHDWGYTSEPDATGRTLELLRARLMGGCSATNATAALRGSPADYDAWAAGGNPGWAFEDVLPFFMRLERDLDFGDAPWHGDDGPLPIRRYSRGECSEFSNVTLDALGEAGFPSVEDHNQPGAVGAGPMPVNTLDGVRYSTAVAYLPTARSRANLTMRPDTMVDRIRVVDGHARAVVLVGGEQIDAGDIVLAAGTYATPPILQRSGIGPASDLRALDIPVTHDLRGVGANLVDHPFLSLDVPVATTPRTEPKSQVGATFHADRSSAGAPVLQLFVGGPWPTDTDVVLGGIAFSVVKPSSRGSVRLRSADPTAPPRIDVAHLRESHDAELMVEAFLAARRVMRTPAFQHLANGDEVAPAPGIADDDTTALTTAIRATVETYQHPVGTCAMGPDPDAGAVVDARGRVHGIGHLRIADASIMPDIPSANTNIPTIMIAERVAAFMTES